MAYVDPQVACAPWTTSDKLCSTGSGDAIDCDGETAPLDFKWSVNEVIAAATNLLFKRTCFRYPGLCERTVTPCFCGEQACVCGKLEPTIVLTSDYPIHEVTEVIVDDGAGPYPMDPGQYRLDEHSRLIRIDGLRWPTCWSDMTVSYTVGREPPIELAMAAAELSDALLKACNGDNDCKLPAHVRSVTRRGVEMAVWDVVELLQAGMTGLPMVDHALLVHGDCRKRSRMFDATRSMPATRRDNPVVS